MIMVSAEKLRLKDGEWWSIGDWIMYLNYLSCELHYTTLLYYIWYILTLLYR